MLKNTILSITLLLMTCIASAAPVSRYFDSFKLPIVSLVLVLASYVNGYSQEAAGDVYVQGNKYISLRVKSLEKYDQRLERQQKKST